MFDPKNGPGFAIAGNKGFQITFANGWTASVQFGYGTYSANRDNSSASFSPNAEVARWKGDAFMELLDNGDTVAGWLAPEQVLAFLVETAARG